MQLTRRKLLVAGTMLVPSGLIACSQNSPVALNVVQSVASSVVTYLDNLWPQVQNQVPASVAAVVTKYLPLLDAVEVQIAALTPGDGSASDAFKQFLTAVQNLEPALGAYIPATYVLAIQAAIGLIEAFIAGLPAPANAVQQVQPLVQVSETIRAARLAGMPAPRLSR